MELFALFNKEDVNLLNTRFNENKITAVQMYDILDNKKEEILSKTDKFTIEDLWYSEYYWYLVLMKEQNVQNCIDFQQGLFKIIESMDCEIEINCYLLEQLEKEMHYGE